MRLKERRGVLPSEKADVFGFIGKGYSNQRRDILTADQIELINQYTGDLIEKYNYSA